MPSKFASGNTTTAIIISLLIIIVFIMLYNYWRISTIFKYDNDNETSGQNNTHRYCLGKNMNRMRYRLREPFTGTNGTHSESEEDRKKNDLSEKGIVKLCIYHMEGCGFCADIMKNPLPPNGTTKFEQLKEAFFNNNNVRVFDFELGIDGEADKFVAFPTILIVSENGTHKYDGPREVNDIIRTVVNVANFGKKMLMDKSDVPERNVVKSKSDVPEHNVIKLCIYHMEGCGHCEEIMTRKQENGKTKFEQLKEIFEKVNNVKIQDFKLGTDPPANKFNAFPVILIVGEFGSEEYNGPREVTNIVGALAKKAKELNLQ